MLDPDSEGRKLVIVNGRTVQKADISLGREFIEDGCRYQLTAIPGMYRQVKDGERFRYGDKWCLKHPQRGAMKLEPNMPYGAPYHDRAFRTFGGEENVFILRVEDRGLA